MSHELADAAAPRPVVSRTREFTGAVWDVDSDVVDLGAAGTVKRHYIQHTGAVAIIALDADNRVYLVRQYRHPVRMECWEPPAGLLDIVGESLVDAARRELHEEADLVAATWHTLVDYFPSGGGSSEAVRVFLARDLDRVPEGDRHERTEEERDMVGAWVPLAQAAAAVAEGRVHSSSAVVGLLAAERAARDGYAGLRPADAPWLR